MLAATVKAAKTLNKKEHTFSKGTHFISGNSRLVKYFLICPDILVAVVWDWGIPSAQNDFSFLDLLVLLVIVDPFMGLLYRKSPFGRNIFWVVLFFAATMAFFQIKACHKSINPYNTTLFRVGKMIWMDPPKHIPSKTSSPSEGNIMIQVEHNETFGPHRTDMYSYWDVPGS